MSSQNPPNPNVPFFNNQYWIQSTDQDSQTLQEVLIQGNSAGSKSINMNNQDITSIGTATMTTLNSIGTATFSGIPTCSAPQPVATDTSTKMPTTSWVQTAITAGTSASANNITGGFTGDLLYQSGVGATAKLPIGSNTYVLTSNGSTPTWTAPFVPTTPTLSQVLVAGNSAGATDIDMNTRSITNATAVTATNFNGDLTGNASSATVATNISAGAGGQLLYQSSANNTAKLTNGTAGQLLQSNGTTLAPSWITTSTPTLSQVLVSGNSAGATDINMNNNNITTATNLTGKYHQFNDITAPFATNGQLYLNGPTINYDNAVNAGTHKFTTYTSGAVQKIPLELKSTETTCGLPINLNTNNITNGGTITATTFNGSLNGTASQADQVKVFDITSSVNNYQLGFTNGVPYSSLSQSNNIRYNSSTNTIFKGTGAPTITFDGNATTATTATNATNSNVTNTASGTQNWLIMTSNSAGNIPLRTSTTGATYNATTNLADINIGLNAATATTAAACSGNSVTATTATKVALTADNTSGTYLIPFAKALSTSEALYVDNATGPLTYNPNNSTLTATTFSGALSGNASSATQINTTNNNNNATHYLTFTDSATGNQNLHTNSGITCNPNTDTITATTFDGTATKVATTSDNTSGTYFIPFTKTATSSETLYVDNSSGPLTYNPNSATLSTTTFQGALNGTASNALQATNQANGVAIPAMYFFYADATGGGSTESGTFTFTALPDTDYGVFSSIYYGYSGSGGTYTASQSSGAISTMIIYNITTTSFSWIFERTTGQNLNVKVVFQLIRSPSLNYAKSY
jgi:hypothetical protein